VCESLFAVVRGNHQPQPAVQNFPRSFTSSHLRNFEGNTDIGTCSLKYQRLQAAILRDLLAEMAHSEDDGRKDVVADINYFAADGTTRQPGIFKKPTYGASTEYARSMMIHDIRPIVDDFKLDVNGFQFVKLPAKERSVEDNKTIQQEYYTELEDIVKDL
jgi:hypothetical protein